MKQFSKIPQREEGQGLVEYALVLVLVAVAIILILTVLGTSVVTVYAKVVGGLNGQSVSGSGSEFIFLSIEGEVSQAGPNCKVSDATLSVVGLDDGELIDGGSFTIKYYVNGSSRTKTVTTASNGITQVSLGTLTSTCPLKLTTDLGYSESFQP